MTDRGQKQRGHLLHAQAHAVACVKRINDLLQDRLDDKPVRDFRAALESAVTNAENVVVKLKAAKWRMSPANYVQDSLEQ
jgi:hypothetical protein